MGEIGMQDVRQVEYVTGKPVLMGTLPGSKPEEKAILLNGHYDVVPVIDEKWSHNPFDPTGRNDGRVYARGTQDMKCVLVQYMEALRQLVTSGHELDRTIHVSFLPDEEVGGLDAAAHFVKSNEFKSMNIGIALDEGLANPENAYSIFYGERASNWVILRTKGPTGHGSRFIRDTAIEKMSRILSRIYSHRRSQESRCHHEHLKLGDVLSMNVTGMRAGVPSTVLRGGFAVNVIPTEAEIAIDIRVPLDIEDIDSVIRNEWIQNELDVEIDYIDRNVHPDSGLFSKPLNDDKWIQSMMRGIKNSSPDVSIDLDVFPAGTDGRYVRMAGVPCIGFSPIRNTPILLHDHDEYLDESVFLEGIDVYVKVIRELASV
jgi:aminoacylase